jgi:hypothetical protein
MVTKSFMTLLERFFLRRLLRRSVQQQKHFDVVQDIIKDVILYWEEAFPEVNQVTLEHHLSNALDGAIASRQQPLSYHDVQCYCGGVRYELSGNFAYHLRCSKVSGWELWHVWDGKEELIGGEYGPKPLRIEISGIVILDTHLKQAA